MKTIMDGGHWEKKGYYYKLYLTLPKIECHTTVNMYNREHKHKKISLPTYILLTNNSIYVNIGFSLLGFGLGLEIQTRE